MNYVVSERTDAQLKVKATFTGAEIEELATQRAIQTLGDVYAPAQAGIKSNVALLSALPQFESVMKLALQDAYYLIQPQIMEGEQAVPVDAPYLQLLDGDFAGTFEVLLTIPLAAGLADVTWKGLDVRYHPIACNGDEVEKRIREVCEQYEVDSPEALIEKTKLYESVDQMVAALEESLEAFMADLNQKAKDDAVREALLRANRFDVPEDLLQGYVDREIGQMVSQIGDAMYQEHLEKSGRDEASFRAEVAKKIADLPRLDIVLDAIAAQLPHDVTDDERLAKIDEQRNQSLDPSQEESADSVLSQLKAQPHVLRSLDDAICRDRALARVSDHATFKQMTPMGLDEYMRYQRTAGPLF